MGELQQSSAQGSGRREEEYTDYSCSTAVERLTRDVETILRAWHVDRGSDHHVTTTSKNSLNSSGHRRQTSFGGGGSALSSVRLIRSDCISWNLALTTRQKGRSSVTIDLELALWDAPGGLCGNDNNGASRSRSGSHSDYPSPQVVKSLQRKPFGQMPAHEFLFDNFSTLFGIGQHISLSPIQPDPIPFELMDSIGSSILERHNGVNVATWVMASTLSGWLQTALNVASSNCRTCIPVFGVWGQYRPDELVVHSELEPTATMSSPWDNSDGSGTNKTKNQKISGSTGLPSPARSRRSGLSQQHEEDSQRDILLGQTIETIKRQKQVEHEQHQQFKKHHRHSSSGSIASNSTNKTKQYSNSSPNFSGYKKVGGVQLFPRWAQAIKNMNFPPELLVRTSYRYGDEQNHHFSTPFVVGNVLTPSTVSSSGSTKRGHKKSGSNNSITKLMQQKKSNNNIHFYRVGANLWVSAYSTKAHRYPGDGNRRSNKGSGIRNKNDMIPSAAAVLASNARLAIWAGVLLQHCPEDAMVVLEGARHVFGWFKDREASDDSRGGILANLVRGGGTSYGSNGYGYYYGHGLSPRNRHTDWRSGGYDEEENPLNNNNFDDYDYFQFYKKQCQEYVQDVYEEAWGCKDRRVPLWGSIDDPIKSVYATITWSGKESPPLSTSSDDEDNGQQGVVEPLLTFPLRIRSRRELSKRDWAEMEESVEKTILDPGNPSRYCVQAYYDRETSVSTLAANQRCVLAALVRAATLPNETLLHHLTDVNLVGRWDDPAGRKVAGKIAERAHVGIGTRKIIDAMDWSNAIEEIISVREAEYVVHAIMNGSLTAGIPSSPEEYFNEDGSLSAFRKSAPWGRLLSVLFAHMARLRSLPSMALVWQVFCDELRRRWDERESLPNMQYVAGLDPPVSALKVQRCFSTIEPKASFSAFLNCSEADPDDYNCLIGQKLQVFNVGIECIVADELLENEAMEQFLGAGQLPSSLNEDTIPSANPPENKIRAANPPLPKDENWKDRNAIASIQGKENMTNKKDDYGPPRIDRDMDFWVMDEPTNYKDHDRNMNATVEMDFDYVGQPSSELGDTETDSGKYPYESPKPTPKKKNFILEGIPGPWHDTSKDESLEEESDGSIGSTGTLSQVYFDAAEAGSIFSVKRGFVTLDTVIDVDKAKLRPGARCPVNQAAISTTGDQLYAPYLQRPLPLTDDIALQRRIMLAKSEDVREKKGALKGRLELAHRLQKPKLLSDMSSFKAANPKCTIDDFTKWYGNPGSPFDDYNTEDQESNKMSVKSAYKESAAKKLDKASEAMRVLVSTRDFWGQCWEESSPVPAAEQPPLFDHVSTVEMVIDYLEQLHPANLMNQVMAVNLSSAYFALASSAKATTKVGIVQLSLKRLRLKTEKALKVLSHDSLGNLSQISDNMRSGSSGSTVGTSTVTSSIFASEKAITACEDACNALSVTETMIARATSLLHKFPNQYKLVSDLLRFADGSNLALTDRAGRTSFLNLVFEQQQKENKLLDPSKDKTPNPMLREYVFRNLDDENPCQLAVRFGDEVTDVDRGENEGGVLLALSKSYYKKGD